MRYVLILLLLLSACSSTDSKKRISLVHTQLGTSHLKEKNFPLAFRELFTAVELDPKNAIAHNQLGLTYIISNRIEAAEKHIKKALDLNSSYTDAKINLAYIYIEKKKYHQALSYLSEAKEDLTYINQHKILSLEGRANFYLNRYEKATQLLRQAILKSRTYCPAHRFFGPSLYMNEKYKRAIKAMEHAIAICEKEKYEELYYYGAMAYFRLGDYIRAKSKLKELQLNYPDSKFINEARLLQKTIEEKL